MRGLDTPLGGVLAAAGSGALIPLSLAPFGWWPLGLISVGAWYWLVTRRHCADRPWLLGLAYGVGKYALGVSWVYVSIHDYGNAPPLLAGCLVTGFVVGMAVFPMVQTVLFARLRPPGATARWTDPLVFVVLFTGFEWLLTWFLTGFPWLFLGYGHLGTVLAGWAPVGGVLLVSAFGATTAVMVVELARRPGAWPRYAVVLALPWLLGAALQQVAWTRAGQPARVALVQGNVDQAVKWLPENRGPIIRTYVELTEPHWGTDVIVWPEAAITVFAHQAQDLLAAWSDRGRAAGTALVLGVPAWERDVDGSQVFHNTAIVLGAGQGRYVKRRLVPFGEYVPLEGLIRGLIEFFDLPMSRSRPGPERQPLLRLGDHAATMAICYEVVYPNLVRTHGGRADVLMTISNDSWFGSSIGPLQHLQMARMRALENGRWLLRGTNNGVTAIVDPAGRVSTALPQFEPGVLEGGFEYRTGRTPYVVLGEWLLLPVAVLLAGVFWWLSRGEVTLRR